MASNGRSHAPMTKESAAALLKSLIKPTAKPFTKKPAPKKPIAKKSTPDILRAKVVQPQPTSVSEAFRRKGTFLPGQSGNPNGRHKGIPNKVTREIRDQMRKLDANSFEALQFIINNQHLREHAPENVIKACALQLAYAHGRPKSILTLVDPIDGNGTAAQPLNLLSVLTMAHDIRSKESISAPNQTTDQPTKP